MTNLNLMLTAMNGSLEILCFAKTAHDLVLMKSNWLFVFTEFIKIAHITPGQYAIQALADIHNPAVYKSEIFRLSLSSLVILGICFLTLKKLCSNNWLCLVFGNSFQPGITQIFGRFNKALQKDTSKNNENGQKVDGKVEKYDDTLPVGQKPDEADYIFIKKGNNLVKTLIEDITHFEGFGDYVKVHTTTQTYALNLKLSEIEERFADRGFMRIHRSFIIHLSKVDLIKNRKIVINGSEIPVSNSYWDRFIESVPKF